jgi:hypothetical protein
MQIDRIEKKDMKRIVKIWQRFDELKPKMIVYIFDILAKVLRYKKNMERLNFLMV